jgi:hypothetical protein
MQRHVESPQSECRFGVARADITPPVGIYHRMWGAAVHDRATGIHRPLTATVAVFQARHPSPGPTEQVLIALDHCLLLSREMNVLLDRVSEGAGVPRERLLFAFSHTHAAGFMEPGRGALPGGELIEPYLATLAATVASLVRVARDTVQPAFIAHGAGRCGLAGQRDFRDEVSGQWVCGFNPAAPADDTLLVARVTSTTGTTLATFVNYACHPTTLAFENSLISPDFPGAMREVVESSTGAPCLFLQGASGDLGPREGFVGGTGLADRNGRQLGYAALAAFEALPPAGTTFKYTGPVVSGATLGIWRHVPAEDGIARRWQVWRWRQFSVPLEYRTGLKSSEELRRERVALVAEKVAAEAKGDAAGAIERHALIERVDRQILRLASLPPGRDFPLPVTLWQTGQSIWVAVEGEHYQWLQQTLRKRFPEVSLWVITLANGSRPTYLPTADVYDTGIYQESIALLARGSLEKLADAIARAIDDWVNESPATAGQAQGTR